MFSECPLCTDHLQHALNEKKDLNRLTSLYFQSITFERLYIRSLCPLYQSSPHDVGSWGDVKNHNSDQPKIKKKNQHRYVWSFTNANSYFQKSLCFYLSSSPKTAWTWRETQAGLWAISREPPHFLGNLNGRLHNSIPVPQREKTRVLRAYFKSFLGLGEAADTIGIRMLSP